MAEFVDPQDGGADADAGAPEKVVDLTREEPDAKPANISTVTVGKASLDEKTRPFLAGGLLLLLAVLTVGDGLVVALAPGKEKAIEAFLKLVYTPIIGLVGSVIGFYFGAKAKTG